MQEVLFCAGAVLYVSVQCENSVVKMLENYLLLRVKPITTRIFKKDKIRENK